MAPSSNILSRSHPTTIFPNFLIKKRQIGLYFRKEEELALFRRKEALKSRFAYQKDGKCPKKQLGNSKPVLYIILKIKLKYILLNFLSKNIFLLIFIRILSNNIIYKYLYSTKMYINEQKVYICYRNYCCEICVTHRKCHSKNDSPSVILKIKQGESFKIFCYSVTANFKNASMLTN